MNSYDPARRLVLQFHITGRCNLRCKHCYREEGNVQPLSLEDIKAVIDQFEVLAKRYNRERRVKDKPHINITGGEPLIREDIHRILDYLGGKRHLFTFGVLTNGSPIDDVMIEALKRNRVSYVQMSIDGDRKTHDELRAPGDYERTFQTAARLERAGIKTYISFTANRDNYRELPKVAAMCRKCGVTKLWSDRLVPIGSGKGLETITAALLPDYLTTLKKARGGLLIGRFYPKTQVAMSRALQFLCGDGPIYTCSAGNSLITVDEFGTILPCRRLPIPCGSVFSSTLEDVYYHSEVFIRLRDPHIPEECGSCQWSVFCKGGARCQSYAVNGDYHSADPACPYKSGNPR